jgi:alpha-D-ribose 1-methylphosphonate 5-triphosphate diphosphatase PhnM
LEKAGGKNLTLSPYSQRLYTRIQEKNKKRIVTADSLFENKTWKATEKIANALRELQAEHLLTIKSVLDHGKFASELVTAENYIEHSGIKGTLRKESDEEITQEEPARPKRKYQKRTVKRSAV